MSYPGYSSSFNYIYLINNYQTERPQDRLSFLLPSVRPYYFTDLRCPKDFIFLGGGGFNTSLFPPPSNRFTFLERLESVTTSDSQGCFGRAKMAVNLGPNQPTSNG